jgi:hypothetical protein
MRDIKPRPNHAKYVQILRGLTPEERLFKAFEISAFSRDLFMSGLRKRFPDLTEADRKEIYLRRLEKCHNRNY